MRAAVALTSAIAVLAVIAVAVSLSLGKRRASDKCKSERHAENT
ncbi:hypothetical protein [Devosia submarina]|nr:hypothetical protein [Devosia submarina]